MPLFKRKNIPETRPEIVLPLVQDRMELMVPSLEDREVSLELVRARFADRCRDASVNPIAPARFQEMAEKLDAESRRRLALAVSALDDEETWPVLTELAKWEELEVVIWKGFISLAFEKSLLTMTVLKQSEIRVEEYARHWAKAIGVNISGETPEESERELDRIDFDRLTNEAKRARDTAEEQMDYLRKLQEAEEKRRRPRGKW